MAVETTIVYLQRKLEIMFKKQSTMAKPNEVEVGTRNHIAPGTTIKGDVLTEGDIRIDGSVEGTLVSKGKLVLGETGEISGEIKCKNANISGKLDGIVLVSEMLTVQHTGKVSGEITYGKLTVEPGAELSGKLSIVGKVKNIVGDKKAEEAREEKSA